MPGVGRKGAATLKWQGDLFYVPGVVGRKGAATLLYTRYRMAICQVYVPGVGMLCAMCMCQVQDCCVPGVVGRKGAATHVCQV